MKNVFFQIFESLEKNNVQYLLIGGMALILHGIPRSTFDSDIIILGNKKNISKLLAAVRDLDFVPMQPDMLEPESFFRLEENQCATFSTKKGDIHLDIFLKKAREFKDLYRRSEKRLIYHIQVPVANLELLLELKENSGREIDQGDILLIRKRLSLA